MWNNSCLYAAKLDSRTRLRITFIRSLVIFLPVYQLILWCKREEKDERPCIVKQGAPSAKTWREIFRYRDKRSRPKLLNLVTRSFYCRMAPFIDYWTLFPQRHIDGSLSKVHPIELYKETYPTLGFTHKIQKRRRRLVRTGTNSWNTKITTTWLNDLYSLNQFKIELPWNNRQMGRSNLRYIIISNSCLWLLYWCCDIKIVLEFCFVVVVVVVVVDIHFIEANLNIFCM